MLQNDQEQERGAPRAGLKQKVWEIIFEAETPVGKFFDVALLWLIFLSVVTVMLETVDAVANKHGELLIIIEWGFTIIFTIEYTLRLWVTRKPLRYATSFFGVIDLVSCIPSYVALFLVNTSGFGVIRILRLLRIFRIFKMAHHVRGASIILDGLRKSRAKITVFFFSVFIFSVIAGTLMYFVEGDEPNTTFTSIPTSIYYAIVSITTVGYGDIIVSTDLGRFVTIIMILAGYAIIAVPTGIVSSAMISAENEANESTEACKSCGVHGHLSDANFCRKCGDRLD